MPRVIDKDDVEPLVWYDPENQDQKSGAVKLVHKPTGIAVDSSQYDTQPANRDAAMRELERRVSEADGARSLGGRVRHWFRHFARRT